MTVAALAAMALLMSAVAPATAAVKPCKDRLAHPADTGSKAIKQATLCLLNKRRKAHGRRALRGNQRLAKAARIHAADMVQRKYFSHTAPGGVSFVDRIMRQDYVNPGQGWTLGENIAWGSYGLATPKSIVRSWMHSPGHRANILNPRFREIGIGVVRGAPQSGTGNAATYATSFGTRF
ncbi:MAG TPA: CAP domain-containing protein [Thermoleophilaceae bacterium]|nr:CAP domain-containing protein [Thermoleophilaceae bacterium]